MSLSFIKERKLVQNVFELHAGKLTMGVVGTVAFGVDLHTQDTDDSENSEAATKLISAAQSLLAQNRKSDCTLGFSLRVEARYFTQRSCRALVHGFFCHSKLTKW